MTGKSKGSRVRMKMKFARHVNELKWDPCLSGVAGEGFGLPWNYSAAEKLERLNQSLKKGEPISDRDWEEVKPWIDMKLDLMEDQESRQV